jgi:hypothetical protein
MTAISDREKAFENKFAHDEALKFKIVARRNKLLGLWAAGKMGKADADAYAQEVIEADFEEAGHEDVFRKVRGDIDAAGISIGDDEIRSQMDKLLVQAEEEVQGE